MNGWQREASGLQLQVTLPNWVARPKQFLAGRGAAEKRSASSRARETLGVPPIIPRLPRVRMSRHDKRARRAATQSPCPRTLDRPELLYRVFSPTSNGRSMSTAADYPHIVVDDSGAARIDATRYKVLHLAAEHYYHGWTAEELLRQHPDLRPEQVYACLAYFYYDYAATIAQLEASAAEADAQRDRQALSRDELLKRRTSGAP